MPAPFGTFRHLAESVIPRWLSREWGAKLMAGVLGAAGDLIMDGCVYAIRAAWLLEDTSPDDAVPLFGLGRGIGQYPGETIATYRARAVGAWDAWEYAGTKDGIGEDGQGIEGQLRLVGYPNAITYSVAEFSYPGDPDNWSRFWVIIPDTDHGWTDDGLWSDPGFYDDGGVWDLTASYEEIRALRNLIRQWKAAHEVCASIVIHRGGELWDWPEGPWSDPGNWDDGDEPIYLSPV